MKRAWKAIGFAAALILLLASCEAVFTTSYLTGLQRDPANLKGEALEAYAESLLASGTATQEELAAAYEAIADDAAASTDPDLQLLAADLALGASGLNQVIEDTLDQIEEILDGSATFNPLEELAGLDLALLEESAALVSAAADNGAASLTGTQALIGAAGELVEAANNAPASNGPYTVQDFLDLAAGNANANLETDLGNGDLSGAEALLAAGGLPSDFFGTWP
jgi:hypothetical protein